MHKKGENKMAKPGEEKASGQKRRYFFPDLGVSVVAESIEEAEREAKKVLNHKDNTK